jgi:rifampicin phosphotransferase
MSSKSAVAGPAARLMTLDEDGARDPAIAGNKAAALAVLRQAGFDVPPGIVLVAIDPGAAAETLPDELQATLLTEVTNRLGRGPWAVRSSSTSEDSEHASFAGQFETFLNVEPGDLVRAVTACFGSANTARVERYRGLQATGSMAVLIQPMIDAGVAGVAFTVDPVSGRPGTIIEAVAGLGDRLVSGEASPERWVIAHNGSIEAPSQDGVLDRARAQAIGALARRVEEHRGGPQDIEWAIDGETLWLLQARPITAVRKQAAELLPMSIVVPPGVWMRDDFHEPVPMSPFGRAIFREQIVKAMPTAFAKFGVLIDRLEVVFIGGWTYSRPISLAPKAIRRRNIAAEKAIASDLALTVTQRWFDQWRSEYVGEARSALALDLRSLSDDEIAAQLDQRVTVVGRPEHTMVGIAWLLLMHDLVATCEELLGWDTARTLTLLAGLSVTSMVPAKQLAELAQLAIGSPALMQLLANVDESTPGKLTGVDPEFAAAFARYLESTAHRAVRFDVVDPNLAERPDLLLRLVADQMKHGFSHEKAAELADRRRDESTDEARAMLASRTRAERDRFENALARAREAYPAMEDKTWHTQAVQTALLRYLGLEIGKRLVDRGQLLGYEDVFFLEVHEARSAMFDGADRREVARLRKGQRSWAMANPGPLVYGEPPSEKAPFHLLPPAARRVNEAVRWGFAEFLRHRPGATRPDLITGTPASSGRYRGPVRVVMGEHEFSKIRTGDVVICPTTSPVWSIVFPSLGALVTDAGGILSHPAIIAREHGIPAVVGAGNATKVFRDGQFVTVNGDTGEVNL